ncbi:MAG: hypothetical protein ACHQJ6_03700 [Candidatus Berkiellales bacterium]
MSQGAEFRDAIEVEYRGDHPSLFQAAEQGDDAQLKILVELLERETVIHSFTLFALLLNAAVAQNQAKVVQYLVLKMLVLLKKPPVDSTRITPENLILYLEQAFAKVPKDPHPGVLECLLGCLSDLYDPLVPQKKDKMLIEFAQKNKGDCVRFFTRRARNFSRAGIQTARMAVTDLKVMAYLIDFELEALIEVVITRLHPQASLFFDRIPEGNLIIVKKALVNGGEGLDLQPLFYEHMFNMAARNNHLDIMQFLLTCKLCISSEFIRAKLCSFAAEGNLEGVKCLIENTQGVISFNDRGMALQQAIDNQDTSGCIDYLSGQIIEEFDSHKDIYLEFVKHQLEQLDALQANLKSRFTVLYQSLENLFPGFRESLKELLLFKYTIIGSLTAVEYLLTLSPPIAGASVKNALNIARQAHNQAHHEDLLRILEQHLATTGLSAAPSLVVTPDYDRRVALPRNPSWEERATPWLDDISSPAKSENRKPN